MYIYIWFTNMCIYVYSWDNSMSGGQNYFLLALDMAKWVVFYRLWRFSHKFEHPNTTSVFCKFDDYSNVDV